MQSLRAISFANGKIRVRSATVYWARRLVPGLE